MGMKEKVGQKFKNRFSSRPFYSEKETSYANSHAMYPKSYPQHPRQTRADLKRSSETPFQDFQTTSFIIKNGTKPSAF